MYTKLLLDRDAVRVPVLVVTVPPCESAVAELLAVGWSSSAHSMPAVEGEIRVTEARFTISNEHRVFLDAPGGNPVSPDGWWAAVSRHADHCVVIVSDDGVLDPTGADLAHQLSGSNAIAAGVLPIVHW